MQSILGWSDLKADKGKGLNRIMGEVLSIIKKGLNVPIIANIPHSSTYIPPSIRNSIILNDDELDEELLRMTDRYIDDLFSCVPGLGGISVIYNYSRLVADPERFEDDENEVMSSKGMGVIYINDSNGNILRAKVPSDMERQELLNTFYRPYHSAIENEVQNLLFTFDRCLVLDCHSFPSKPLPYELNQDLSRPDICLGTDSYHTSKQLIERVDGFFKANNLTVALNMPFEGTYVPPKFLKTHSRVSSLMIEINRKLYMDEKTGQKSASFNAIRDIVTNMVQQIMENEYEMQLGLNRIQSQV